MGAMTKKRGGLRQAFATAATAVIVFGGAGFGLYEAANSELPASAGISYFNQHGYRDVTTTGNPFYTGCPLHTTARSYMATDKKTGVRQRQTLCFGLFHQIYKPS